MLHNTTQNAILFASELGWIFLIWQEQQLTHLKFGYKSRQAAMLELPAQTALVKLSASPEFITKISQRLEAYASGVDDDFRDIPLDFSHLTPFQQKVTQACRAIPAGQTRSYAALAEKAGSPRAARAVGNVMRSNRYPLLVPCHRVIGSNGKLCGFTSPQGLSMKERLLLREQKS
jgi:methylated-DNA-[protein]-cysteine S-methyltransferase